MRIALDAMGSDKYPVPDVAGGVLAAREWGDQIIFVGHEDAIKRELYNQDTEGLAIEVVEAPEVIEMDDDPAWAAREKKNSSMHVGMNLVRDNRADAYVTAGNTGGVLAVATLHSLRRIRGIKRPALAAPIPFPEGHVVAIDIGANADCKPENLVQFALMGAEYARAAFGHDNPRVALLSNGEEEGKGNDLTRRTCKLLSETPLNYIGNVEPKEVATLQTDVVVCDGFAGNVFIKTIEATAKMLNELIREEIMSNPLTSMGGILAKPAFRRVAKRVDPFEVGGVPLLGVNGVVIIAHGRSNERAIMNSVGQARRLVEGNVLEAIRKGIESV